MLDSYDFEINVDFKKWYLSCSLLLKLGFDLERNSAEDLLCAINEVYSNFDEYYSVNS